MLSVPVSLKRFSGGFRLEKIKLDFPFNPKWETVLDPRAKEILSQPFSYLSRGSQSYVFLSEDGNYVIKFFRFDLRPSLFKSFFSPLFLSKRKRVDFNTKVTHLFEACKMAYDRAAFETGIVYLHINPTDLDLPVLLCKDALGRKYHIPLDRHRFVVQRKVETFGEAFKNAMQEKNPLAMIRWIDSIFDLVLARSGKWLHNSDPNLSRNLGFFEGRAIEIDFGNYCNCFELCRPEQRIKEINRFYRPLHRWLQEHAPEWVDYLDRRMDQIKQEI